MLTDAKIRQAKPAEKPYRLPDAARLYLEVRPSGAKVWLFRYELPVGKGQIYTIGQYPAVSLADARKARDEARDIVKSGVHPKAERDSRRQSTIDGMRENFKAFAEEWLASKKEGVSSVYAKQMTTILNGDVYPSIGHMKVQDVRPIHIFEMLKQIENRNALSIMRAALRTCSGIFQHAVTLGVAEMDPTAHIGKTLKKQVKGHYGHIPKSEIPALLEKLESLKADKSAEICLKLMLLLFPRPVELRKAEWEEFDLTGEKFSFGGPAWIIPGARMKMRREHVVPLSAQAVTLLQELHRWTGQQEFLFPARRAGGIYAAHNTINRLLADMGYAGRLSGHGFRHTASTALHDAGYNTDHIEMQLSHFDGSVRGVYNRALYLPERRKMMQDWADMVMPGGEPPCA